MKLTKDTGRSDNTPRQVNAVINSKGFYLSLLLVALLGGVLIQFASRPQAVTIPSSPSSPSTARASSPKISSAAPTNNAGVSTKVKKASAKVPDEDTTWPPTNILENIISSQGANNNGRRLVVVTSNFEYADFADNFCNSLVATGVTNFVLVPLDPRAYAALSIAYPNHTLPLMPDLGAVSEGPADYNTLDFQNLTATRPFIVRAFLRKQYTIFYNDIDMVWQKNAWEVVDERNVIESALTPGIPTSAILWQDLPTADICTCFMYLNGTSTLAVALVERWADAVISRLAMDDQLAFKEGLTKPLQLQADNNALNPDGIRVFYMDEQFPLAMYLDWGNPEARKNAVIVHNNYIIGKQAKLERFINSGLWKPSGRLPSL